MSKSARLRLADLRTLNEVAHECRDLGDDAVSWRIHWYKRLAAVIGADLALGGELSGLTSGHPVAIGVAEWGWDGGFDRVGWLRALELMRTDPNYSLMFRGYGSRLRHQDGLALSASDFVEERDWLRSVEYQEVYRTIGVNHNLWCTTLVPSTDRDTSGEFFCRAAGARDFSGRDKAILAEAHALTRSWVGGPLARFTEPSPGELAPRVRQVLACLLEGDSDKQVATRLGIGRHTVNQYVKVIFRHFRVTTRAELLARWISRGWNAKHVWAADPPGTPL